MLRCALVVTGDESLAQDCVQDVTLYWLRKFPGFRLEAKVTTFLYPVVRHTALDLTRRSTRAGSIGLEAGAKPAHPVSDSDAVVAAMGRLSLDKREMVHLVVVEGLTLEQAAQAVGVPVGTAKSRLHYGLHELESDPVLRRNILGEKS